MSENNKNWKKRHQKPKGVEEALQKKKKSHSIRKLPKNITKYSPNMSVDELHNLIMKDSAVLRDVLEDIGFYINQIS